MKSIIKTITTLLIIVITFTSAEFANANNSTADTLKANTYTIDEEKIEQVLLYGLDSDINGVLESTFFNVISYKALYPEFNSTAVIDKITSIAVDERNNHVVRYKAMLTISYLKDQNSFDIKDSILPKIQVNDANGVFQVLVDSIRDRHIAGSTQK